ncbi:conserved hypothetical protein [Neospora caninum Liverpool]|uniref:Uncharacterized protein n=1 Tax=Neospora caninum (strain Liverpool) TaxID=572307 RepID=F0VQ37_NEOCL|nr:conserved hypothetical protein [Neospora caninum Liverpool]CBZ55834.1 conserved hypothetical protein [Neospora caninum Liverpool]CEL70576.1 TPA: hypothetical protein BN1204_062600 [Neospora caninum Liverpool]|eukprot:XP_003885860.1 conserved hypothetical protein [Neospora caninum Liverpool]
MNRQNPPLQPSPSPTLRDCAVQLESRPGYRSDSVRDASEFVATLTETVQRSRALGSAGISSPGPCLYASSRSLGGAKTKSHRVPEEVPTAAQADALAPGGDTRGRASSRGHLERTEGENKHHQENREEEVMGSPVDFPRDCFRETAADACNLLNQVPTAETQATPDNPAFHTCADRSAAASPRPQETDESDTSTVDRSVFSTSELRQPSTTATGSSRRPECIAAVSQETRCFSEDGQTRGDTRVPDCAGAQTHPLPPSTPASAAPRPAARTGVAHDFSDRRRALQAQLSTLERTLADFLGIVAATAPGALAAAIAVAAAGPPSEPKASYASGSEAPGPLGPLRAQETAVSTRLALTSGSPEARPASAGGCGCLWRQQSESQSSCDRSRTTETARPKINDETRTHSRGRTEISHTREGDIHSVGDLETSCGLPTHRQRADPSFAAACGFSSGAVTRESFQLNRFRQTCNPFSPPASLQRDQWSLGGCVTLRSSQSVSSLGSDYSPVTGENRSLGENHESPSEEAQPAIAATCTVGAHSPLDRSKDATLGNKNDALKCCGSTEGVCDSRDEDTTSRTSEEADEAALAQTVVEGLGNSSQLRLRAASTADLHGPPNGRGNMATGQDSAFDAEGVGSSERCSDPCCRSQKIAGAGVPDSSHASLSQLETASGAQCSPALSWCSPSARTPFSRGISSRRVTSERPTDWTAATPSTAATCTPETTSSSALFSPNRSAHVGDTRSLTSEENVRVEGQKAKPTDSQDSEAKESRVSPRGSTLSFTADSSWPLSSETRLAPRCGPVGEPCLFPRFPPSFDSRLSPPGPRSEQASQLPAGSPAGRRGACAFCGSVRGDSTAQDGAPGSGRCSCGRASLPSRGPGETLKAKNGEEGIAGQLLHNLLLVLQCLDEVKDMQATAPLGGPWTRPRGSPGGTGRWRLNAITEVAWRSAHAAAMTGALAALPSREEARPSEVSARRVTQRVVQRGKPTRRHDEVDRLSAAVLAVSVAAAGAAACAAHAPEGDRDSEPLKRPSRVGPQKSQTAARVFREGAARACNTQADTKDEKRRFFRSFSTPGGTRSRSWASECEYKDASKYGEDRRARRAAVKRRLRGGGDGEVPSPESFRREAGHSSWDRDNQSSCGEATGVSSQQSEDTGGQFPWGHECSSRSEPRGRADHRAHRGARERNGALALLQGSWVIRLLSPASPERKVEQRGCAAAARSAAANFFFSFAGGKGGRKAGASQERSSHDSHTYGFPSSLFRAGTRGGQSEKGSGQLPQQEKCFLFVSADFGHLCCSTSPPPSVVRAPHGPPEKGGVRSLAESEGAKVAGSLRGEAEPSKPLRKDARGLVPAEARRRKDALREPTPPENSDFPSSRRAADGQTNDRALEDTDASTSKSESHGSVWTLAEEETADREFGASSRSEKGDGESDVGCPAAWLNKPLHALPFQGVHTSGPSWGTERRGAAVQDPPVASSRKMRPRVPSVSVHGEQRTWTNSPRDTAGGGANPTPETLFRSLKAKGSPVGLGAESRTPLGVGSTPAVLSGVAHIPEGDHRDTPVLGYCCLSDSSLASSRARRASEERVTPVVASPYCVWAEEGTPESEFALCGAMSTSTVSALRSEGPEVRLQIASCPGRGLTGPKAEHKTASDARLEAAFSDGQGDHSEGEATDTSVAPSVLCAALPAFASCRRRQGRGTRKACPPSSPSSAASSVQPGHAPETEAGEPGDSALTAPRWARSCSAASPSQGSAVASLQRIPRAKGSGGRGLIRRETARLDPAGGRRRAGSPQLIFATSPSCGARRSRLETAPRDQAAGDALQTRAPASSPWGSAELMVPLSAVERVEYGYSSNAYCRLQRSNCAPLVAIPPYLCCSIRMRGRPSCMREETGRAQRRRAPERGGAKAKRPNCSSDSVASSAWRECMQSNPGAPEWGQGSAASDKSLRAGQTRDDDLETLDFIVLTAEDAANWVVSLNRLIQHNPLRVLFTADEFSRQLRVMRKHHMQRLRLECLLAHTQLHMGHSEARTGKVPDGLRGPSLSAEKAKGKIAGNGASPPSSTANPAPTLPPHTVTHFQELTAALAGWDVPRGDARRALKADAPPCRERHGDVVSVFEDETDTSGGEADSPCRVHVSLCRPGEARRGLHRLRRYPSAPPLSSCCSTTSGSGGDLNSGDEFPRLGSWTAGSLAGVPSSGANVPSSRLKSPREPGLTTSRKSPQAGGFPSGPLSTFSPTLTSSSGGAERASSHRSTCASGGEEANRACTVRPGCACPKCTGIRAAAELLVRAIQGGAHAPTASPVASAATPPSRTAPEGESDAADRGDKSTGIEWTEGALPDASEIPQRPDQEEERSDRDEQLPSTFTHQRGAVLSQSPLHRSLQGAPAGPLGVNRDSAAFAPQPASPVTTSSGLGVSGTSRLASDSARGPNLSEAVSVNSAWSGPTVLLQGAHDPFLGPVEEMRSLWRSRSFTSADAAATELRRWDWTGACASSCPSRSGAGTPGASSRSKTAQALLRFVPRGWGGSKRCESSSSRSLARVEQQIGEGQISGEETPSCVGPHPSLAWPSSDSAARPCLCPHRPASVLPLDRVETNRGAEAETKCVDAPFAPSRCGPYVPFYGDFCSRSSGRLSPLHISGSAACFAGHSPGGPRVCMHRMNHEERSVEGQGSAWGGRGVPSALSTEFRERPAGARSSRSGQSGSGATGSSDAHAGTKRRGLSRGFSFFSRRRTSEKDTHSPAGKPGIKRSASCFTAGDRQAGLCLPHSAASVVLWGLRLKRLSRAEHGPQTPDAASVSWSASRGSLQVPGLEGPKCMHPAVDKEGFPQEAAALKASPHGVFAHAMPPFFGEGALPLAHPGETACAPCGGWAGCSVPLASLRGVCGAARNEDSESVEGSAASAEERGVPVPPSLLAARVAGGACAFAGGLFVPLPHAPHSLPLNLHAPHRGVLPQACVYRTHALAAEGLMHGYRPVNVCWKSKDEGNEPGCRAAGPLRPAAGLHPTPVSSPYGPVVLKPVSDRSQEFQASHPASASPHAQACGAFLGREASNDGKQEGSHLPRPVSCSLSDETAPNFPEAAASPPGTLTPPGVTACLPSEDDEEEVQFCIFSEDEVSGKAD